MLSLALALRSLVLRCVCSLSVFPSLTRYAVWQAATGRVIVVAWVLWMLGGATAAHAVTELRTLIDSDGNPATGCTVTTASGTFAGAELAALTRIDLAASEPVGDVSREICQGGALVADPGFVPLAPLRWPVGVAAAGHQLDVVESYTRLLAPGGAIRLGFMAGTSDGSLAPTALLTSNGTPGGGLIQLQAAPAAAVPGLGTAGLVMLAGLLLVSAYRFGRARHFAATGTGLCLALVVGLAWAAMVRDGSTSDWSGTAPIATASASGPLRFAAVYARVAGNVLHLRYDLDLGLRDGTVRDDDYTSPEDVSLAVPAPGLLGNDTPGTPAMQVTEVRLPGSPMTTPAGAALPFAGSSLHVNADGGFVMHAPVPPGLYRFEYRARNRFFSGQWGVATVQVTGRAYCGDGVVSAGEACDDGNTSNEVACSYGAATCTGCNSTCTSLLNLSGPHCGDGAINGPEFCDDGNTETETSCPYGPGTCTRCNASCTATMQLTGDYCGDGVRNGPEACDDGNTLTETSCPYGVASCTACSASCSVVLHLRGDFCGDGVVNGVEACDSTPGCSNICTLE